MGNFDYPLLLLRLLPETIMVIGALAVLFLDQAYSKSWTPRARGTLAATLAGLTLGLTIFALSWQGEEGSVYGGMLVLTRFTQIVQILLALLAGAAVLLARPDQFTEHIGEYLALLLMGTIGLLALAATEELLTAFIALELSSLSLYLMTGFNKGSVLSAEAGLKYFLFGSVSAAFTLYSISLWFGLAGSTQFSTIAEILRHQDLSPILIVAIVMTAIGFSFKMAAAPLHFWAPDVYQGAPVPSAALIASGSKLASFVLFMKFLVYALPGQAGSAWSGASARGWTLIIAAIAATSVIVGNLLAIAQTNLRRLLAYSAVAHAGYILIAVLARDEAGVASGVYYLFTYGLSIIGLFGVVSVLEEGHREVAISDLAGLSRRAPGLAICLAIFVLSLAGIPPLAGFFGKFYVFVAALEASKTGGTPGLLWIVALALAASVISLFYYLQVLKHAFVLENNAAPKIRSSLLSLAMLFVLAASIIYLGCNPEALNAPLRRALSSRPAQQHAFPTAPGDS